MDKALTWQLAQNAREKNGKKSEQVTNVGSVNVKIAAVLKANRSAWTEQPAPWKELHAPGVG